MKDHKFNFTVNLHNLKKYFLFAYPIIFISIFTWGISFSDRYFIEYLIGTGEVETYALLAQVAGMGQIIGQIYTLYVYPHALKLFESDTKKTFEYISKMLKRLKFTFILLSVIAYFLPRQIYTVLLDGKIIHQEYYFNTFFILLIGIFTTVLQTAYSMYLNLFKRLDILSYIYLIALIINISINYIYIKEYGILAASIATLASYLIILLAQIFYVQTIKKTMLYNIKSHI